MVLRAVIPPLAELFGEQRPKFIPPVSNGFMTDIDASLMQQILYILK
jgi:hypothetical protein